MFCRCILFSPLRLRLSFVCVLFLLPCGVAIDRSLPLSVDRRLPPHTETNQLSDTPKEKTKKNTTLWDTTPSIHRSRASRHRDTCLSSAHSSDHHFLCFLLFCFSSSPTLYRSHELSPLRLEMSLLLLLSLDIALSFASLSCLCGSLLYRSGDVEGEKQEKKEIITVAPFLSTSSLQFCSS